MSIDIYVYYNFFIPLLIVIRCLLKSFYRYLFLVYQRKLAFNLFYSFKTIRLKAQYISIGGASKNEFVFFYLFSDVDFEQLEMNYRILNSKILIIYINATAFSKTIFCINFAVTGFNLQPFMSEKKTKKHRLLQIDSLIRTCRTQSPLWNQHFFTFIN